MYPHQRQQEENHYSEQDFKWEDDEKEEEIEEEEIETRDHQNYATQLFSCVLKIQLTYAHTSAIVLDTLHNGISLHHSHYCDKQPYHTPALSGSARVLELLTGHPKHIQSELGVWKHVFNIPIQLLSNAGYGDSRCITLEEQFAIFYMHALQAYHLIILVSDFNDQVTPPPSKRCLDSLSILT